MYTPISIVSTFTCTVKLYVFYVPGSILSISHGYWHICCIHKIVVYVSFLIYCLCWWYFIMVYVGGSVSRLCSIPPPGKRTRFKVDLITTECLCCFIQNIKPRRRLHLSQKAQRRQPPPWKAHLSQKAQRRLPPPWKAQRKKHQNCNACPKMCVTDYRSSLSNV